MIFGKKAFMKKKNYRTLLYRLSVMTSLSIWLTLSNAGCKSKPKFPEGWSAGSSQERGEYDPLVQKKLDDALKEFFENPVFKNVNDNLPEVPSE